MNFKMGHKTASESSPVCMNYLLTVIYVYIYFFSASIIVLSKSSLAMFKSKAFTVRRRYSDFLGLFEKLTVKQSLQGFIIPPPPEKSVVGE